MENTVFIIAGTFFLIVGYVCHALGVTASRKELGNAPRTAVHAMGTLGILMGLAGISRSENVALIFGLSMATSTIFTTVMTVLHRRKTAKSARAS